MAPGNGLSCIPLKERRGKFEKIYKVNVYAGDDELQAGIAEWIHENTRMPMPRVLPQ